MSAPSPLAPLPPSAPSIEIDLSALVANYQILKAAAPNAETAAVVKCNAYGLGLEPVARALAIEGGARSFFVVYADVGAKLRTALNDIAPDASIYIFNGPDADTLGYFRKARLTPVINTPAQAALWTEAMGAAPAALHVDTGMNRFGASHKDAEAIAQENRLVVDMVMTHLACVSRRDHPMIAAQQARFDAARALFPTARASFAASGGALICAGHAADLGYDMVRPGIALYGGGSTDEPHPPLNPVARLSAPVRQLREVSPGESVGYDATYRFDAPARVATVALGYGDGFPRSGSNRAEAFIGGALCPVIGRISMDFITLDVTHAPDAIAVGDRAEFFGPALPIDAAAARCNTISYELLTGLGGRLDRRYLWGDKLADERFICA